MEKVKKIHATVFSKIKISGGKIIGGMHVPQKLHLSRLRVDSIKQLSQTLFRHKFLAGGAVFACALILFMAVAIYRGYFMISANSTQQSDTQKRASNTNKTVASAKPTPSSPSPSVNPSPSVSTVLGASNYSSTDNTNEVPVSDTPSVAASPMPTDIPEPTIAPVSDTSSSNNSSSGNSNCTTGSGVPNSWYSDVYPNPPVVTSNGNITLIVNIRDCSVNDVSKSSTLKISLSSGDTNTEVNGHTLPYSLTTQNGQVSFSVSSQVVGTVGLVIQDTTDSFTLTNVDNNNPSIDFSASTVTPTPTQAETPTPTQAGTPTPTQAAAASPTISTAPLTP